MPLGCGDEEGGRGGVAVAVDVAEEAVFGDCEGGGDFADEVDVGLVHEEEADVGGLEVVLCEEVFDGAGDFAGGLDDDVEALHLDGSAVLELEGVGVVAVGEEGSVGDAEGALSIARWLRSDEAGSGAVAEEDRGVWVGVGDAAGHYLGCDDEDVAVAGGEIGREREGDERAGAGYGNVDGGSRGEAEFLGEDGGGAGEGAFGGAAAEEDEADILGGEAGVFETGVGCGEAEVCDGRAFGGVAASRMPEVFSMEAATRPVRASRSALLRPLAGGSGRRLEGRTLWNS